MSKIDMNDEKYYRYNQQLIYMMIFLSVIFITVASMYVSIDECDHDSAVWGITMTAIFWFESVFVIGVLLNLKQKWILSLYLLLQTLLFGAII